MNSYLRSLADEHKRKLEECVTPGQKDEVDAEHRRKMSLIANFINMDVRSGMRLSEEGMAWAAYNMFWVGG